MLAAIAVLAASSLPAAIAAERPTHKPKAKLVVTGFTFESTPAQSVSAAFPTVVLGKDGSAPFGIAFTIKNIGKAKSRDNHPSLYILDEKRAQARIGPLAPGQSITVRKSYTANGFQLTQGFYDMYACVATKASRSCSEPLDITVIPKRWNVDLFTTGPNSFSGNPPFDSTTAFDMSFNFFGTINDNGTHRFLWLASGGVLGKITGENGFLGCSYSGSGTTLHGQWDIFDPVIGYLEMTTDLDGYFAWVYDSEARFMETISCPLIAEDFIFPTGIVGLETTGGIRAVPDRPMTSDSTTLAGKHSVVTGLDGGGVVVDEWSFAADLP